MNLIQALQRLQDMETTVEGHYQAHTSPGDAQLARLLDQIIETKAIVEEQAQAGQEQETVNATAIRVRL